MLKSAKRNGFRGSVCVSMSISLSPPKMVAFCTNDVEKKAYLGLFSSIGVFEKRFKLHFNCLEVVSQF